MINEIQDEKWHVREIDGRGVLRRVHHGGISTCNYGTLADAQADYDRMAANGNCRECGDILYDHWEKVTKAEVLVQKLCHSCLFWTKLLPLVGDPTHLVVGGQHYTISPDVPKHRERYTFVGHGGARFDIRFTDGREVVTHNLWAQGRVPDHFRDRFPDNAEFLKRGHRTIGAYAGYGGMKKRQPQDPAPTMVPLCDAADAERKTA